MKMIQEELDQTIAFLNIWQLLYLNFRSIRFSTV